MKRALKFLIGVGFLGVIVFGYHQTMMRVGSGTAPEMASSAQLADEVVVFKSQRKLNLLRDGVVIKEYGVSLGDVPTGHKQQEGDERTPEGQYVIDWRNENSIAHLSLHISYPNETDKAVAKDLGVSPGGNIMIHGMPNGWGFLGRLHLGYDWTNGCIAVTNAEMREIWGLVPNGTPITIMDKT